MGCGQHPAFPAPSSIRGCEKSAQLGRQAPRGRLCMATARGDQSGKAVLDAAHFRSIRPIMARRTRGPMPRGVGRRIGISLIAFAGEVGIWDAVEKSSRRARRTRLVTVEGAIAERRMVIALDAERMADTNSVC